MLTILRKLLNPCHRERGQVLVVAVGFLVIAVAVAAVVIDGGFFFQARRDSQNTADAGALAGAQHLPDDPIAAVDAALAWANHNGWTNGVDGVTVTATTPFEGNPNKIEVIVNGGAPGAGIFDALMNVESRAVAEVIITDTGPGGGGPGGEIPPDVTPMAPVPIGDCADGDNANVDGRVTADEGYDTFADLVGEFGTDFGEAFFACDASYYYFALRLNGRPSTGGGVANENVYQCNGGKAGQVDVQGNEVKKLKGFIAWVGSSSFTMDVNGDIWTVDVDGSTIIEVDKQPATINDLAVGQEADVKGTLLGPNHALASKVKAKTTVGSCGGSFSSTYHADYNTGWVESPKGTHTFKDLLNSDRARFQVACGDSPVHDFVQDYLRTDGSAWASDTSGNGEVIVDGPAASASSLEYNLEHPIATGWGDEPGEDPLVQSPPFSPTYPDYSSDYDGWVWEMIYEFKVPRSAYDTCGSGIFFGLPPVDGGTGPVGGMHASPAKVDEGVFVGVGEQTTEIRLVE